VIVAVAAGKGGVGKSTTALNLAAATEGLVVDADLGMANLPGERGPDLHDVLAGRADPLEAVDESGPVDVLPCGRSLAGARAADPRKLDDALSTVERAYGPVVVDCPAGLSADAGLPLLSADACVLVATPDAVALPDVLRTRALARELDAGVAAAALNRAGADPPRERFRRILGAPVVPVPESTALAGAQASGVPVASVAPDAAATAAFDALADELPDPRR